MEWFPDLKENVLRFLQSLQSRTRPGFYRYSYSGDLFNETLHWGLGNSVFAAKILYMLDSLTDQDRKNISSFINSFQDTKGYIFDPVVQKKSFIRRWYYALRSLDFNNLWNEMTRRAETRQSFAALRCLGKRPENPYLHIPYTKEGIERYINSLNWEKPWGAGSHVSHLLFFLHNNRVLFNVHQNDTDELIDFALEITNHYLREDGSWYATGVDMPMHERVNAAMKMMTAYDAAERNDFFCPEKLIDLCMATINDGHACNNFNIICVLYHCSRKTDYRISEIKEYCLKRLEIYKKHYWPEYGGFSFFERQANRVYYGAKISCGLKEPDIHGTVLFLWGITLITKILGLADTINLKVPIT